jgi:hypothetical protein
VEIGNQENSLIQLVVLKLAYNVSVLYDVADFQQKAQYEAPNLN